MRRGLLLLVVCALAILASACVGVAASKPPIAGVTLDGDRLALADLRGKPVVINVWSSW